MPVTHVDFERYGGSCECGTVMDDLGPDRKPVWRGGRLVTSSPTGQYLSSGCTFDCSPSPGSGGTGAAFDPIYFAEWFVESPGENVHIPLALVLNETSPGLFSFKRATLDSMFFPINARGWGTDIAQLIQFVAPNGPDPAPGYCRNGSENCPPNATRLNFNFVMEIHAEFVYSDPNATFSFTGDDDVYLFLNNKLVLDLGGLHPPRSASIRLGNLTNAGMQIGKRYNFDFFLSERHFSGSNCEFTTTIVPVNRAPGASGAEFSLLVGETVSGQLMAFDPDFDALTYFTVVPPVVAPLLNISDNSYTFTAPASLGNETANDTSIVFAFLFFVSDGEFQSCNATVSFLVTQPGVPPSPAPPTPRTSSPILSKSATIALIVVGSVLVLAAIAGAVALVLFLRSRTFKWEKEIEDALTREGLLENPLYEGNSVEYTNLIYDAKEAELGKKSPAE